MPTARSIIAIAVGYPNKLKGAPKVSEVIAEVCLLVPLGGNSIMRKRLDKLADFIQSKVPDVELKSMVDTGVLSDRAVLNEQV